MNKIELYIKGKNVIKTYSKVLMAHVLPQLTQYVGKKIFTIDGSKTAKFVVDLDGAPQPVAEKGQFIKVSSWLIGKHGYLWVHIKICINGGSYDNKTAYCEYFDREIELAKMDVNSQILESIVAPEEIIKAYGLDDVLIFEVEMNKIKNYKALHAEADKVKDTIKVDSSLYKYL